MFVAKHTLIRESTITYNILMLNMYNDYTKKKTLYDKDYFSKVSKNLARYRSENNFVGPSK